MIGEKREVEDKEDEAILSTIVRKGERGETIEQAVQER